MRPLRFRIVALIAAYALALHGLLLALAVVAPANAGANFAALCSALTVDQSNAPPDGHDASCAMACAMLSGKGAAATPPIVAVAAPVLALVRYTALDQAPPRPAVDGRPRARAPPLV